MATYVACTNSQFHIRQHIVSRLWQFCLYPSRTYFQRKKDGSLRNQELCQCTVITFKHSFKPLPPLLLLATVSKLQPNANCNNTIKVRPKFQNCTHRVNCGYRNKFDRTIKDASVTSMRSCFIANSIYIYARHIVTHLDLALGLSPWLDISSLPRAQLGHSQKRKVEIQKVDIKSKGGRSHWKWHHPHGFCIAASTALLFFNFNKEEEDNKIELLVAKAVSAEKRGQFGDAANFYHQAVTQAQQENKKDKVAFIYDMMANFYLRIDENYKAEKLFKETIKLLLESGFEQSDPAVLEISLKLAGIYELQFRNTEAEAGYRFCISKSEEGLEIYKKSGEKDFDKEMNLYAMLGVSLEAFGKFMLKRHHLEEAEKAYIRAIRICENELADKGKPHPQTAILLNDLGTVYEQKKNYTKAMETICRAEELAKDSKDDLAIIICNKASLHLRNGNREDATRLFRQALRLAERSQDEETIRFVKIAMSKLAAPLRKES